VRQAIRLPYQDPSSLTPLTSAGTTVYPNPVQDVLNINFGTDQSKAVGIEFVDCLGKTLYHGTCMASQFKLDVSAFPKGLYLLKINGAVIHSCTKIRVN